MVRPAQRREVVDWARAAYQLSERKACRVVGVSASFLRYRSRHPDQAPLRVGVCGSWPAFVYSQAIASFMSTFAARAGS